MKLQLSFMKIFKNMPKFITKCQKLNFQLYLNKVLKSKFFFTFGIITFFLFVIENEITISIKPSN